MSRNFPLKFNLEGLVGEDKINELLDVLVQAGFSEVCVASSTETGHQLVIGGDLGADKLAQLEEIVNATSRGDYRLVSTQLAHVVAALAEGTEEGVQLLS